MAVIAADEKRFTETPLVRRIYRRSSCGYETLTRGDEFVERSRCFALQRHPGRNGARRSSYRCGGLLVGEFV
jgi:hypothetical protein